MSDLMQKFYDTFGIEPEINYVCDKRPCKKGLLKTCADIGCSHLYDTREDYPDITAEKLLQMICIILNAEGLLTINTEGNIADIKDFVLRFLIGKVNKNNPYCHYKTKNKIKQQIQQLFKD